MSNNSKTVQDGAIVTMAD